MGPADHSGLGTTIGVCGPQWGPVDHNGGLWTTKEPGCHNGATMGLRQSNGPITGPKESNGTQGPQWGLGTALEPREHNGAWEPQWGPGTTMGPRDHNGKEGGPSKALETPKGPGTPNKDHYVVDKFTHF